MYARTNSDIVPAALKGQSTRTRSNSFSTYPVTASRDIPSATSGGGSWLSRRMSDNLQGLADAGRLGQVILSYRTVIAFQLDGQWIRIDDSHSAITSVHHESKLWKLPDAVWCPRDASREELDRIAAGLTRYVRRRSCHHIGSYVAA